MNAMVDRSGCAVEGAWPRVTGGMDELLMERDPMRLKLVRLAASSRSGVDRAGVGSSTGLEFDAWGYAPPAVEMYDDEDDEEEEGEGGEFEGDEEGEFDGDEFEEDEDFLEDDDEDEFGDEDSDDTDDDEDDDEF